MDTLFTPKIWARNSLLQTIYGSLKLRNRGPNPLVDSSEKIIVDAGEGVRLLGYLSRQKGSSKGLVLLIHGWEGSSDSSYIIGTGNYLYSRGYDIFRLNLRDHGDSHHLNEGLFNSSLIDEVFRAAVVISGMSRGLPFFIIGFSLGGNFSLRIALRQNNSPINNLKHIIAVSPALDPKKTCKVMDSTTIIKNYFVKKWKRSLYKKQEIYPDKYDFSKIKNYNKLADITGLFLPLYAGFKNSDEYYKTYTLLDDVFMNLCIPVTVITAEDDPIIPIEDFYNLRTNGNMNLLIQPYGGHNGFFDFFPFKCWYEEKIYNILSA